jgi:hypothetical protein
MRAGVLLRRTSAQGCLVLLVCWAADWRVVRVFFGFLDDGQDNPSPKGMAHYNGKCIMAEQVQGVGMLSTFGRVLCRKTSMTTTTNNNNFTIIMDVGGGGL